MWVSNYNIYIPLQDDIHYLLVHGYTGAVDLVDTELAQALQNCFSMHSDISVLALPSTTLQLLERRGYLTELSPEEEIAFVGRLARKVHAFECERTVFWIIPSYACQLRCKYCFERPVQNKGEREGWLSQKMSHKQVVAVFSAIRKLQGENTIRQITLYGGEPLLPGNREIIEDIVSHGTYLGYRFMVFTNGVDVNIYADMLGPDRIEKLHVTLDGPQVIHDQLRVYANGGGTFERITENIELALNRGVKVLVRVNLTWDVLGHLDELAEYVQERGWDSSPEFQMYCQAIHSNQQYQSCISPCSFQRIQPYLDGILDIKQLGCIDNTKVARYLYEAGLDEIFLPDLQTSSIAKALLTGKPSSVLKASSCYSHRGWYIFDPFGNIYCCSRLAGKPHYRIGVFVPQLSLNENEKYWRERTVCTVSTCQKCRYALYCRGGCAQQALVRTGDLYSPYCDNFPKRFKATMIAHYRRGR